MKVDERGNVYCGGPGGVWVVDPDGRHLGTIGTPGFVGNLTFGEDWRSLFLCVGRALYRLRMHVAGAAPAWGRA